MKKILQFLAIFGLLTAANNSQASLVYGTASGATSGGQSVDAQATLTFGTGTLTILLQNLQSGEISSGQAISGVILQGITGTLTLVSAYGDTVDVSGSTVTPLSTDASLSHWGILGSSEVSTLTGGKPSELVVGPSPNGNGGFGNFNPYVNGTATLTLSNINFTANSSISGLAFVFGTPDATNNGVLKTSAVPEPSTVFAGALLLLPLGMSAIRVLRKKRTA